MPLYRGHGGTISKTCIARDPKTGKNYKVDGDMTFEKLKAGLSDEQKANVKAARTKPAKSVDKSGGSGIIKAKNVETAVSGVNFIGKIDREIYKCVAKDITTDEVILSRMNA